MEKAKEIGRKIVEILGRFFRWAWKHKLRIAVVTTAVISVIVLSFIGTSFIVWTQAKPGIAKKLDNFSAEINTFVDSKRPNPIRIVDKNGVKIGEFYFENFRPIRVDNLKDHQMIIWALLSMEDRSFFSHFGINIRATLRAVLVNLMKFKFAQGGSTITQQLAKLTMDLGSRNLFNKMTETYATFYIESRFSKEEILAMYLNEIFLGQNSYGVEAAARFYFNKSATVLTPAEAAMIVGVIPAPSVYNPNRNLHIALARQRVVLNEMQKNKDPKVRPSKEVISKQFSQPVPALITEFRSKYEVEEVDRVKNKPRFASTIGSSGYDSNFLVNLAPDFNSEIRTEILETYKEQRDEIVDKDIIVYTTLDYEKQKLAVAALSKRLEEVKQSVLDQAKSNKKLDPKMLKKIADGMIGSFVAINPSNGDVEVFVNNLEIGSYRPNHIESTNRQSGSTIKGLVYALAFEKGLINPSSILIDEEINIGGYSPKNWYSGFRNKVTTRHAFAQSINTIPVVLLHKMGVGHFKKKLGEILSLSDEEVDKRFEDNLTLALGSAGMSSMETAIIYATLQNGGKKVTPRKIIRVAEASAIDDGLVIEPRPMQVLDPVASAMTLNLTEAVVRGEGTMTVRMKDNERFPIGGKTGSVQTPKSSSSKWGNLRGPRDAWFAGLSPYLTSVVWIGNRHSAPFPGSGSGTTGRLWEKFIKSLNAKDPILGKNLLVNYEIQGSYLQLDICTDDGTELENGWEDKMIPAEETKLNSNPEFPEENDPEDTDPNETGDENPENLNPENSNNPNAVEEVKEPKMVANPKYCKLPAFGQYYYIGDSAPKRKIISAEPTRVRDPETGEEYVVQHRGGQREEVNQYDETMVDEENPGLGSPELPMQDGGVELEEPFIDTPEVEEIF